MPNYDLSSIGALTVASELAHIRANREPSQDGYNAAWLHGYASALADAAKQLEPQQELIDAITGYMGQQHDSAELYAVLHDTLAMSDGEIMSLGFDLPQCRMEETRRGEPGPPPESINGYRITDRFTVGESGWQPIHGLRISSVISPTWPRTTGARACRCLRRNGFGRKPGPRPGNAWRP